jgi:hypothetical protein
MDGYRWQLEELRRNPQRGGGTAISVALWKDQKWPGGRVPKSYPCLKQVLRTKPYPHCCFRYYSVQCDELGVGGTFPRVSGEYSCEDDDSDGF